MSSSGIGDSHCFRTPALVPPASNQARERHGPAAHLGCTPHQSSNELFLLCPAVDRFWTSSPLYDRPGWRSVAKSACISANTPIYTFFRQSQHAPDSVTTLHMLLILLLRCTCFLVINHNLHFEWLRVSAAPRLRTNTYSKHVTTTGLLQRPLLRVF